MTQGRGWGEVWRTLWLTVVIVLGLAAVAESATDIGVFINSRSGASALAGTEKLPCTQGTNTTVSCAISQIGAWLTGSATTWTGQHANIPRQTLTASGSPGTFTPPSSFGNYFVTTGAASQSIACPTSMADGEGPIFHVQQGVSAPFSPNISFASPCYGWASRTQPTWSTGPNAVDSVFCWSMSPADITTASFICSAQLNAGPPALTIGLVSSVIKMGNGAGSVTTTSISTTGATLIVVVEHSFTATLLAPTDSASNTGWTQAVQNTTAANAHVAIFYKYSPTTSGTHTFTNPVTSGGFGGLEVYAFNNTTGSIGSTNGFGQTVTGPASIAPGAITATAGQVIVTGATVNGTDDLTAVSSSFTGLLHGVGVSGTTNAQGAAYLVVSTGGSINPTWTITGTTSQYQTAVQAAFN